RAWHPPGLRPGGLRPPQPGPVAGHARTTAAGRNDDATEASMRNQHNDVGDELKAVAQDMLALGARAMQTGRNWLNDWRNDMNERSRGEHHHQGGQRGPDTGRSQWQQSRPHQQGQASHGSDYYASQDYGRAQAYGREACIPSTAPTAVRHAGTPATTATTASASAKAGAAAATPGSATTGAGPAMAAAPATAARRSTAMPPVRGTDRASSTRPTPSPAAARPARAATAAGSTVRRGDATGAWARATTPAPIPASTRTCASA